MGALVSRRSLLLAGAAVGSAAAAGGFAWLQAPGTGLRVLSSHEVRLVEGIAGVLFPPGYFPVHGGDGGTAPGVDELLARALDPAAVGPFRYLLRAMDIGTLVARGRSFLSLSDFERAEVVAIWSQEEPFPRRIVSDSLQVVIGMAFFRRPEVLAAIGWEPGCGAGKGPGPL